MTFQICEYGTVKCKDDFPDGVNTFSELFLEKVAFENLYSFVLENQSNEESGNLPFVLFSKSGRKQIKIKNYVGVIETRNGLSLEILPKIHVNKLFNEIETTRFIFLKMLRHLKNSPFINLEEAHIKVFKNFPILEVFISSYLREIEKLISTGLKSNYMQVTENISFAKGKILVHKNIKYNFSNRAAFYCEYFTFSTNVPPNRIIKSTLQKLLRVSNSYKNKQTATRQLVYFELVEPSTDPIRDLDFVRANERIYKKYKTIIQWSEIFLLNKAFTNFKGNTLNLAVLFPMERIFEDYIAYLVTKYSDGYIIRVQDKKYFLVEKHLESGKFRLKPDLVAESNNKKLLIIDTKWKLINQYASNRNYNISQADMYQLYAYGKKYSNAAKCTLILLYPSNLDFTEKLDKFIYEGDLELNVVPFEFDKGPELQIEELLKLY